MLETVKEKITRLIAAYETEKMEREKLQAELEQTRTQNETYRKQIIELERQIDNLKLTEAFMAGGADTAAAAREIASTQCQLHTLMHPTRCSVCSIRQTMP